MTSDPANPLAPGVARVLAARPAHWRWLIIALFVVAALAHEEIEAPVGKTVTFGGLAITVRDCEKNPPEDQPESAAFLQIDEVRPGEVNVRRFSGWMFAQSPALSSLENPVYDVILLDCKAASAPPSPAPAPPSSPPPPNTRGKTPR